MNWVFHSQAAFSEVPLFQGELRMCVRPETDFCYHLCRFQTSSPVSSKVTFHFRKLHMNALFTFSFFSILRWRPKTDSFSSSNKDKSFITFSEKHGNPTKIWGTLFAQDDQICSTSLDQFHQLNCRLRLFCKPQSSTYFIFYTVMAQYCKWFFIPDVI